MRPPIVSDLLGHLAHRGDEIDAAHLGYLGESGAGIGDEHVGIALDALNQVAFGHIVLILDITDHHLDEVFDGDEPVGPAIFVDDEGHMRARRLHPYQEIDGRHGWWHEQDRALDPGRRPGSPRDRHCRG